MAENNGEGRWLTAEETVAAGLADRIIDNVFVGSLIPDPNADDLPADIAETPKLENSIAGEIIRFILGKLAYRLEEWIEQLRDKHIAKRKERLAEKEFTSEEIIDEAALPQAEATQPQSSILFDEGQRRYTATQVKATEDPTMSTPHTASNEKAYADDAKAFGRY